MGKTKKKSKSTARGTDSSRGVAPIDFEAPGKNNPPFRFACFFPDNPGLTVGMGTWGPSMGVPMVVVGRGKHVVGYSWLAIKSIG